MAPVMINPQFVAEVLEREFPRISHPPPVVDDVFVIVVSITVVGSLTIYVLIQAVGAVKSILKSSSTSPLCALPTFRKKVLLPDGRTSPFLGPHRCQFTLSPERYDTDSDTSSTLARPHSRPYSTDYDDDDDDESTVVGGRICVVYDDSDELDGIRVEGEEEEEEGQCRSFTFVEPRPRVRREQHWQS